MTNQNDFVIDNGTGLAVRQDIQDALQALAGLSSGDSAPSTTYAFQLYANTTSGMLQIRNAANSAFIDLFQLDGTFTLEDGSASAPALSFRTDLDTGIAKNGTNGLMITAGGVQRFSVSSSEVNVNDTGAATDFRVESDSNSSMFIVDGSANRVGIGAATPAATLDLAGNMIFSAGSPQIQFNAGGPIITNLGIANTLAFLTDSTTERMRIDSSGNATLNSGSLILSTAGQGIEFHPSGASNANLMDDYEEGSWTPVLGATSTDPTVSSYSHQVGRYTKIGNVVNLFMFLDIGAGNITNAGSGDGLIRGLPFAIDPTTGDQNGAAMINFAQLPNSFSTGRNDYRFFFGAGENILRIHQYSSDNPQVQTGLGSNQIANGNRFKVGFVAVYRTNA